MFPSLSLTLLCGLLQRQGQVQGWGKGRGCLLAIALQVTSMASGMPRLLFWAMGIRGTAH